MIWTEAELCYASAVGYEGPSEGAGDPEFLAEEECASAVDVASVYSSYVMFYGVCDCDWTSDDDSAVSCCSAFEGEL